MIVVRMRELKVLDTFWLNGRSLLKVNMQGDKNTICNCQDSKTREWVYICPDTLVQYKGTR